MLFVFVILVGIGYVEGSHFTNAPTMMAASQSPSNAFPTQTEYTAGKIQKGIKASRQRVSGLKGTTCPDGWLAFDGSCYLFGHNSVHFTEAEHFCRQHHSSHLINVHNKLENDFIKDRLREFTSKTWWLGLTDEMIEGTWRWFDTDDVANFTDWFPGQPDAVPEDCATFYAAFNFAWGDLKCLSNNYPICELRGLRNGEMEIIG